MGTVYLEKRHNVIGHEEQLLTIAANQRGLNTVYLVEKQLARNQIDLTDNVLVAGSVPFMRHALRNLGKDLPNENCYPEAIWDLLYREVKALRSLREAKQMLDKGQTLFIKPAHLKRFTGFVTCDSMDPRFNGVSDSIPVWVATPVQWLSEWRSYVYHGAVLCTKPAPGADKSIIPDFAVIYAAVEQLSDEGAPDGYAIDFGVLATGETALVEMNDGFSIGAYGDRMKPNDYWSVITARWWQLIAPDFNPTL